VLFGLLGLGLVLGLGLGLGLGLWAGWLGPVYLYIVVLIYILNNGSPRS